ncbi:MAG TPA: SusC/RagA family TonB-linked outer membrane protein [Gemmatimonadales bacterium]|nr:SusC/RagA family TonB-linked outer membrane protein [Gemmatimonadales bacterium]
MSRAFTFATALVALGLAPAVAGAQNRDVTGKVTRVLGDVPVAGATVVEVGGPGVAQTDNDGKFSISIRPGDARLMVRAIGYQRKEIPVPSTVASVTISLEEDPFKLEAVVVTGQATTLERRNATTASVQVSNADLNRAPAESPEQALQGKVPGAIISMNSGAPGGGGQVQIRGITSILGAGQPLFVVDGVIISNDAISDGANSVTGAGARTTAAGIGGNQDALVNRLADLNPQEIESIEVIKSAAATAMYGSRATNGVVVIKTKRGTATAGASQFNFTGRLGRSVAYRLLGTRQFTSVAEVKSLPYGNGLGADSILAALYPTGTIRSTHDYQSELYNNGSPSYELTGSFNGGTPATQYYVNITGRNEEGTAPNTGARLYALRTNIDQTLADGKLKFSAGLNVTRNSENRGLSNNDNTCTSPIYCFAYTPGVINLDSTDATGTYIRNPFNGGGNTVSNPFETFQYLRLNELTFRQIGNLNATWSALNLGQHQISFTATGGFDRAQISGDLFSPSFLQYETPVATDGYSGRAVRTEGNIFNYNLSVLGTWNFQPTPSIGLTTTAGYDYETQYIRTVRTRARGLLPGVQVSNSGAVLDQADVLNNFRDDALFATEQVLAFDQRLAIVAGVRADRSSANGDRTKRNVFPRVSASYRFPDLGDAINEVKIRGGIGKTGNRPNYGFRDVVLNAGTTLGGVPTLVQAGGRGNPNITPETLNEIEGGADITFLNRRLNFEGTYYNRKITDLLLQPATIPSGGITNLVINGGELHNRGIEAALSVLAKQSRDIDLNFRATFSKNRQDINNLPSSVPRFPVLGSFGAAFGRNFISPGGRTTWIWGNVPLDANGKELPIGTFVTNPGAIAAVRDTVAGDANPDFMTAFTGSFRWKRFTLGATVDWRQGGQVADMTRTLYDEGGTSRDYDAPITRSNFGAGWDISNIPATYVTGNGDTLKYNAGSFRYNSWAGGGDVRAYLESATNVTLRDVSFSYEAPDTWLNYFHAHSMRISFQARNLFKFTNYWSFDPEFNNFGATNLNRFIDLAPFPSNRQFYLSVDMGW